MSTGWIGVDLDGTLAFYDQWRGEEHVGAPIPVMLQRVKKWLDEGQEVRIFTARVSGMFFEEGSKEEARASLRAINAWCKEHLGRTLIVTALKDYQMIELWDDRAVQVVPNTGRTLAEEHEAVLSALRGAP